MRLQLAPLACTRHGTHIYHRMAAMMTKALLACLVLVAVAACPTHAEGRR